MKDAIILAFSRGEELEPFTSTMSKFLIPVFNQPVLEHNIEQLRKNGIENITLLLGYKGEMIEEYFKKSRFHNNLNYIYINNYLPFEALSRLLSKISQQIIILEGDIYSEDSLFQNLNKIALKDNKIPVILLKQANPMYHQKAKLDDKRRIISLVEITQHIQTVKESMVANICILSPENIPLVNKFALQKNRQLTEFFQFCLSQKVYLEGISFDSLLVDIDYPWEILAANYLALDLFEAKEDKVSISKSAKIENNVVLKGTVTIGDEVVVENGTVIKNAKIDDNTYIKANSYIEKSVIGKNCTIGPLGFVQRSCLGDSSNVGTPAEFPWAVGFGKNGFGHHCHAGMGVYGKNTGLSAGAIVTANRSETVKMRIKGQLLSSGWRDLGAFIGEKSVINANANIMPGRKIGPYSVVGPGIMLYRDLDPYQRIIVKQEQSKDLVYFPSTPKDGKMIVSVPEDLKKAILEYRLNKKKIDIEQCAQELNIKIEIVKAVINYETVSPRSSSK